MHKASWLRVVLKDIIDFGIVFVSTVALTFAVYFLLPSFTRVEISLYFLEQSVEIFFLNPKLVVWLAGLGLGVSVVYFLLCAALHQTTIGGVVARVRIVDKTSQKPLSVLQAILMGVGAYFGVLAFLVGPLSAWWLDHETRGFSEKCAGTVLIKKVI